MSKPNRTRTHNVCIRMNDEEYQLLQQRLNDSGQTQQSYIVNAVTDSTIASAEEIQELRHLGKQLEESSKLFRISATNLNQVARNSNLLIEILQDENPDMLKVNNLLESLPDQVFIEGVADDAREYRKEVEAIWQSLRQFVARQKVTPV